MPSRIFSENRNVRIWIDETAPFVFTGIRVFPQSQDELNAVNVRKIACIRHLFRKYEMAYSIFDASEAGEFDSEMLVSYAKECLADQYAAGLAYKAFLKPENPLACQALLGAIATIPPGRAGVFDNFEQALDHITALWHERDTSSFTVTVQRPPGIVVPDSGRWASNWYTRVFPAR